MGAAPLVSVGLPVYNGERFLTPCLESLVAQTYPNYEIIVSDNASTDQTPGICRAFARGDPRIRYLRAERNQGASWNHNRVLELARGELFKWCGADDALEPRFLEACVAALENRPDAALAFPRTVVIDAAGTPIDGTTDHLPVDSPDPVVRFRSLLDPLDPTHDPFYGVMRKERLLRARPLGAFLAADRCLLTELALLGPFVEVSEYLMYHRVHVDNVTRGHQDEQRLYDPRNVRPFKTRAWRVLRESVVSVSRASLSRRMKLRLLAALASWAIAARMELYSEGRARLGQAARRFGLRHRPAPGQRDRAA